MTLTEFSKNFIWSDFANLFSSIYNLIVLPSGLVRVKESFPERSFKADKVLKSENTVLSAVKYFIISF